MKDAATIENYLRGLSKALRALPDRDRDDIVAEIRAHLEHRTGEGKLAEAIKSLGAPDACARSFIEEMKIQTAFADGGAVKTFGALLTLASRRVTATAGLFVSLVFFLLAAGFAFTGLAEIVAPDKAGLWVGPDSGSIMIGTFDTPATPDTPLPPGAPEPPREILGRWLIPFAAGMSVLFFVIGQISSRLFIRLMMRRKSPTAI
ncbi:MAG: hypothetical protein A3E78_04860 [Alphaproteobacteria bacterium RIFCSPHIGHO2_12_FULL_63_12]|nr:MAG: hypothetical protein A3E78_04860 [Alphaproteobacteria bacterium RIFCSPHIGHO2_12_FULL_63_12]